MKINFKDYSIERSKYLVDPLDDNILDKLKKHDEFNEKFTTDKEYTCRYIVLMYDMNSSLRLDVRDFWERKRVAASIAGFTIDNRRKGGGGFDPTVENMLLGEDVAVNNAITKYILLFGIPEYAALIIYETMLVFEVQKTLKNIYTKDTPKIIDFIKGQIKELTEELYGGKEVLNARKALYSRIERERAYEKPEEIIKRINEGDTLKDFSPYEGYEPQKMKFLDDK